MIATEKFNTLSDLMRASLQPMFLAWGEDLSLTYNDAYAALLGARHPAAWGRPLHEAWRDTWPQLEPMIRRAYAGEPTWVENLTVPIEKDGRPQDSWWTFSYSPIREDDGRVAGVFCACSETTALVRAQQSSVAERERLFEMTRDLFGVATLDGYLQSINPAWAKLLHRDESELLARPFSDIIHPDDLANTAAVVARLAAGEPVHQFHVRLITAEGQFISLAWSAVPDPTPGSNLFYTTGRDITEDLRRDEAARQTQKMEALGQLTGGIAHDFNNLLQTLQGTLELIRLKAGDAERGTRLANLGLQATERGARLTAHLLAFSRAQKLELQPVAISPLLLGMEEMVRRTLGSLVQVNFSISVDGASVLADSTQLEMALLNLAINARDAMSGGGDLAFVAQHVDLSGDHELPNGRYVEIRVEDNGHGMPAAVMARAFDPFFTTKGVGKGTGLGLSQVYGMARQAGGTARLESGPGRGTRVTLLLPALDSVASTEEASVDDLSDPLRHRLVMVVDDDDSVRDLVVESLMALGCDVAAADGGQQALALLENIVPDVILLDFAMPGMNGAEVAQRVRATHPSVPIVFASGYSDSKAIEEAVGTDFPILRKPFRLADLEAVLRGIEPMVTRSPS